MKTARVFESLLLSATLTLALATPAFADDKEAASQALFDQAMKDMAAGAYDKACPALADVVRSSHYIGAMIALGKCYEGQGKLASAWASYRAAAETATLAQDKRAPAAAAKASELASAVSHLTIEVDPENVKLTGLTISRGDQELTKAEWSNALPVDGGLQTVTAQAPGFLPWTGTVEVPARAGTSKIQVPRLLEGPHPPGAAAEPGPLPPPPPPPAAEPKETTPTWAWVSGGGGILLLAASGVFAGVAVSAESSFHGLCPNGTCPFSTNSKQGQEVNSDVSRRTTSVVLSSAFGAVGIAAVGIGAYGIWGTKKAATDARLIVLPGGARLEGRF